MLRRSGSRRLTRVGGRGRARPRHSGTRQGPKSKCLVPMRGRSDASDRRRDPDRSGMVTPNKVDLMVTQTGDWSKKVCHRLTPTKTVRQFCWPSIPLNPHLSPKYQVPRYQVPEGQVSCPGDQKPRRPRRAFRSFASHSALHALTFASLAFFTAVFEVAAAGAEAGTSSRYSTATCFATSFQW